MGRVISDLPSFGEAVSPTETVANGDLLVCHNVSKTSNKDEKLTVEKLLTDALGNRNVTITSGGSVGIGTTSPLALFDVSAGPGVLLARCRSSGGSSAATLYQNLTSGTGNTNGIFVGISSSADGFVWNYESRSLIFGTENAERVRITSAGRVGIGTTSPGYTLDVVGTTEITPTAGNPALLVGRAANQPSIKAISDGYLIMDSGAEWAAINYFVNRDVYLAYGGGNVGIGTDTSGAKLDVDQSSATANIPTLRLEQADVSEEFIRFDSTVGAGNAIDTAALGSYYGKIRVNVNGVDKFIALYNS